MDLRHDQRQLRLTPTSTQPLPDIRRLIIVKNAITVTRKMKIQETSCKNKN